MIRSLLKQTHLFAHNQLNRDEWIRSQSAKIPSNAMVLDVGAGSCPYRNNFKHCNYLTQDFCQLPDNQLLHGTYGRIDYVCDVTNIPVENDSFDVVICTEVMEHVVDPQKLIQEISRILKPGGLLLLSAPLGSGLHQEPHHYYGGFTPYWYRHFFPKFGFCDLDITANAGSFSFFAQESLRFARLSIPTHLYAPLLIRIAWAPFWIILAPLLCILIPLLARFLDRYDTGKHFTVGYHVQARKKPA